MFNRPVSGCDHDFEDGLVIAANGRRCLRFRCTKCFGITNQDRFTGGLDLSDLPIFEDNRIGKCERCGELGTETHHWAPTAIFGIESHQWPTAQLCRVCHSEWHSMMKTPGTEYEH